MDFATSIKTCVFQKYVCFQGRAQRSEYWYYVLFNLIINIIAAIIDIAINNPNGVGAVGLIASVAFFLPTLGVSVRRLHDINRSGWWLLIALVPLVGAVVILIWTVSRGSAGDNRFGPDPLPQQN